MHLIFSSLYMFFFSFFNLVENILYFPWLWILVFHHYYSIHSYLLFKYQISFIFSNLSNSLIRYALEYHTLFFTLLFLLHNFLSLPLCTEFWIISLDLSIHYSFLQFFHLIIFYINVYGLHFLIFLALFLYISGKFSIYVFLLIFCVFSYLLFSE